MAHGESVAKAWRKHGESVAKAWRKRGERKFLEMERVACSFPGCGKSFPKYALTRHNESHMEPQYACDEETCKSTFKNKDGLKRHKESVHQPKQEYACSDCGKTFPRKDQMSAHQRRHGAKRRRIESKEDNVQQVSPSKDELLTPRPSPSRLDAAITLSELKRSSSSPATSSPPRSSPPRSYDFLNDYFFDDLRHGKFEPWI